MKRQKGFSVIEGLLILVIVGMLGGIGWYVLDKAGTTSTVPKSSNKQADPTADWAAYSSSEGAYSLKHPKTWVKAANPELCNPGLLLIGADSASVGKCATEDAGQMMVFSVQGLPSGTYTLKSGNGYEQVSSEEVTVNGVKGLKQSGVAKGQEGGSLVDGTEVTTYIFQTNDRTYVTVYAQHSSYKDVLADFNLMITETLKFSS